MTPIDSLVVIAGVRKSGTTSLYHALADHSSILGGETKEPHFFCLRPNIVAANLSWYRSQFPISEKHDYLLDGSTTYFASSYSPHLISKYIADPKILFLIRDPVKRAHSGYLHMHKAVPCKDRRAFEEIVVRLSELRKVMDSRKASDELLAEARLDESICSPFYDSEFHRREFGAPFATQVEDPDFGYRYFLESEYSRWLVEWEREFGNRVKVLVLEEVRESPQRAVETVCEFLNIDPSGSVELGHRNPTKVPAGSLARVAVRSIEGTRFGKGLAAIVRRFSSVRTLGRWFWREVLFRPKAAMDPELYSASRALLSTEYSYWEERKPATKVLWKHRSAG